METPTMQTPTPTGDGITEPDTGRETAAAAAAGRAVKRAYVQRMFTDIAPYYDRVNTVISFRLDGWWRRRAVRELHIERDPAGHYLDLCAGTLDITRDIVRTPGFRGRVAAADFSEAMLRAGRHKAPPDVVEPVTADALALPFADGFAAGAIVVFGMRNVVDLDGALREVHRVLRPGARFVMLEFGATQPAPVRWLYRGYFDHVCPLVGNAVAHHGSAYNYLPESVRHWPAETEVARRMTDAGFANVEWRAYTFGVVAVHVGEKR